MSWLRLQLREVLVLVFVVALLFAGSRWIQRASSRFPDARPVSLAFAEQQIADGNVELMEFAQLDGVPVGYGRLVEPVATGDSTSSVTRTFVVRLPDSERPAASLHEHLQAAAVPFAMSSVDHGFTWVFSLGGAMLLVLATLVYLRVKHAVRSGRETPAS